MNSRLPSALPGRITVLGTPMHPWSMEQTVAEIARRMDAGVFTAHVGINVAELVNMRRDSVLHEAVSGCDIINIDGMGVVWGARMLGFEVPERVAGIDLFLQLLALAEGRGDAVFFLGAREDVVEKAVRKLRDAYPSLRIAGWHHGYFSEYEDEVVKRIAESGADMLFVAMSSPKKEQFIHRWRQRLGVKLAMGVGGSFDIVAGETKRAPPWMQRAGLEWLYRTMQEPGRMWRRYLVTNGNFLWLLVRARTLGK